MLVDNCLALTRFGQSVFKKKQERLLLPQKEDKLVLPAKAGKKRGKWNSGKRDYKPRHNSKFKKDKENSKCFNCGKSGHFVADCWKKGKGKHNASSTKEKHAPEKKNHTNEPQKYYFLVTTLLGSISESDVWLIDSGASRHMTGSRNLLSKVSSKHSSLQVELGDNAKYEVKGVGFVSF